jgi:hypothetical protein
VDLEVAITKFLQAALIFDPAQVFRKGKFHVLIHIIANIRRFGPAPLFSVEASESNNIVIRAQSINSNRQAPSRDIAMGMDRMGLVKFVCSGGVWRNPQGKILCMGAKAKQALEDDPSWLRGLGFKDVTITRESAVSTCWFHVM